MRSLTLKLTLAFLVVSLTGVALAAIFARWTTLREFDRLIQDQAESSFISDVAAYYQTYGTWVNVAANIPHRRLPAEAAADRTLDHNRPKVQPDRTQSSLPPFSFVLVDQQRLVVVPGGSYQMGERVSVARLSQGAPIEVGGQVVGTVLRAADTLMLDAKEQQFLARVNQALFYAALIALVVAFALGLLFARTLAHPLREMTTAAQAMSKGELRHQVPIRSRDELGQLAAAFNQMSANLAHATELRQQMTADIAHELRTPLTVITGYIEALRDGVLKPTPSRFDTMHNEAQQLKRLVEDLRTLSLADAGELPLTIQATPPRALLERLLAAFAHRAEQSRVALKLEVADNLPAAAVDAERIIQVLENLVSNALRHTPAGGEITVSAQAQPDAILFAVQDNGEGIAPDVLPHIFDRFYRGDAARGEESGASGLGLAIAKSIVEAHGGSLTAASHGIGAGSTFTVRLPRSPKL